MKLSDLKSKKVLVWGLGLHGGGVGVVKLLSKYGAEVRVTDLKSREELSSSLEKLKDCENVEYILAEHRDQDFEWAELVMRNPDVPDDAEPFKIIKKRGIPVENEITLLLKLTDCKVVGVTGTRGKSTTTTLVYEMLKKKFKDVHLGGNIRAENLALADKVGKDSVLVLEISNLQLKEFKGDLRPLDVAVLTNIYKDHLDKHSSFRDYVKTKARIFMNQGSEDFAILNKDDRLVRKMKRKVGGRVVFFSSSEVLKDGVFVEGGKIRFKVNGSKGLAVDIAKMRLMGPHNVGNACAAVAVAAVLGVDTSKITETLEEFKGIEHRLEFVRELNGVRYFNDTTSTMPEATIAALKSFPSHEVVLIAGGSEKNLPFDKVARAISDKAKSLVLLEGKATPRLEEEIEKLPSDLITEHASSMEEAVEKARQLANPGDVVLLSPACASFGMFKNEFDRGEQFTKKVNDL